MVHSKNRARLLERERQAALRQAVYEERTRIARELHDHKGVIPTMGVSVC